MASAARTTTPAAMPGNGARIGGAVGVSIAIFALVLLGYAWVGSSRRACLAGR